MGGEKGNENKGAGSGTQGADWGLGEKKISGRKFKICRQKGVK